MADASVLETPCREWHGRRLAKPGSEYGLVQRDGRTVYVHRLVSELVDGPIPAGVHVLHRCDNPPCFRHDHLFRGTHADNMKDMVAKGRRKGPHGDETHCPQGHPYDGENLRLTAEGHRKCRICQSESARKSRLAAVEG